MNLIGFFYHIDTLHGIQRRRLVEFLNEQKGFHATIATVITDFNYCSTQ
jgi:hypothetical protein